MSKRTIDASGRDEFKRDAIRRLNSGRTLAEKNAPAGDHARQFATGNMTSRCEAVSLESIVNMGCNMARLTNHQRFQLTCLVKDVIADGPGKMTTAEFVKRATKEIGVEVTRSHVDAALQCFSKTRTNVFANEHAGGTSIFLELKKLRDAVASLEIRVSLLEGAISE